MLSNPHNKGYRSILALIPAVIMHFILHEGMHVLTSSFFGEFEKLVLHIYGPEVLYVTPPTNREGFQWFLISGLSNMFAILVAYMLFLSR